LRLPHSTVTAASIPEPSNQQRGAESSPRTEREPNAIESGGTSGLAPQSWSLTRGVPNPFHRSTTIDYAVPSWSAVELKILDVSGRLVRTLVNEPRDVGRYGVVWDGRNERGARVASGVYFCRLRGGTGIEISRKMVMLR
jgi:hypothetical protein